MLARLTLVLAACTFAQTEQKPLVRTTVPLIQVPIAVNDRAGKPWSGLSVSDFVLLDEQQPKPISLDTIDTGLPPVALAVLIENNDRSRYVLGKVSKMGGVLSEAMAGANGKLAIITYNGKVTLLRDFSDEPGLVSGALRNIKPSDDQPARLYDAIGQAVLLLNAITEAHRSVILIIGEKRDRGSETKFSALQQTLGRANITVYALSYSSYLTAFTVKPEEYTPDNGSYTDGLKDLIRLGKANALGILAHDTGGVVSAFETRGGLENALMRIATDLHNRYLLSFRPEQDQPSRLRQIAIRVNGHPDAIVHARSSYWTASP